MGNTNLTPIPLPQTHTIRVHVRDDAAPAAIPRDAEPEHQLILADELVQKEQFRLIAAHGREFKRADEAARDRLDGIVRGRVAQVGRVDAEHVDLVLALFKVGGLGHKVELEAEGARAVAGEAGEDDDEVLVVAVGRPFGDLEKEGGAAEFGGVGILDVFFRAVGVGEVPAADGVGAGEVAGGVWVVREDVVSSGGLVEWTAFGIETQLGGGEREEGGEEGEGVGEGEMHSAGLRID